MTPDTPQQALPQLPSSKPEAPVFGIQGSKPKKKGVQATFLPNAAPSAANSGIGLGGM